MACRELQVRSPGLLHSDSAPEEHRTLLDEIQQDRSEQDSRWIEVLLWALMKLCIGPSLRWPSMDLESKGFYRLEASHHSHFLQIRRHPGANLTQAETIAHTLIPLFRHLNGCLKSSSSFLMSYDADWAEISSAVTANLQNLEFVCGLLVNSASSSETVAEKEPEIGIPTQSSNILSRGEAITLRIASLLGENSERVTCHSNTRGRLAPVHGGTRGRSQLRDLSCCRHPSRGLVGSFLSPEKGP